MHRSGHPAPCANTPSRRARRTRAGAALLAAAGLAMLGQPRGAAARDPFSVTVTVDGQTGSQGFTRLQDAYNALDTAGLQNIVGSYTDVSAATASINLRGVPASAIYTANSPSLRIIVPGPGIDITFNGATRDESQQLFVDWLRGQGSSQVNDVLRYAAANTAIDPVAGNPNAAMNQFVAADTAPRRPRPRCATGCWTICRTITSCTAKKWACAVHANTLAGRYTPCPGERPFEPR